MSEGIFQSGLPTGTQRPFDYDASLLNAALAENAAISSQELVSDAHSHDMQLTEVTETEHTMEPEMRTRHRENDVEMSNEQVTIPVTEQCLSPSNPFAAAQTGIGGEMDEGNPRLSDPANPFFDALRSGEQVGDTEVDRNVVTDSSGNHDNRLSMSPAPAPRLPISTPHCVKWLLWRGHSTPIATQNENGPCPLLAICNTLLLSRKLSLEPGTERISSESLAQLLANHLLESVPKNLSESQKLDYDHNVQDAIAMFPKLQTGLDVNVKFSGVRHFEFTQELIVFDLLNIHLYHGWLADPQNHSEFRVVQNLSYNQLVEKIINSQSPPVAQSPATSTMTTIDGFVAENFLNTTASQLTYHGLSELGLAVQENELCVFFRNNHFSSMYKYQNHLYLLVTDQGYLDEPSIVWEDLSNVEGDTSFFDEEFQLAARHTQQQLYPSQSTTPAQQAPSREQEQAQSAEEKLSQEDQDFLMAVSLQQSENEAAEAAEAAAASGNLVDTSNSPDLEQYQAESVDLPPETSKTPSKTDHELAMQLQQEEYEHQHQGRSAPPDPRQVKKPVSSEEKKSECRIL